MIKARGFILIIFVSLLSFIFGCGTTDAVKSSISSITSRVDKKTYDQVPDDQRDDVRKAEVKAVFMKEKLKLAELNLSLAKALKEKADLEQEIASNFNDEAELDIDIAKIEAIDKAGLGKRDQNIKNVGDLKAKRFGKAADREKIAAKIKNSEENIRSYNSQIKEQEEKIKSMESEKDK